MSIRRGRSVPDTSAARPCRVPDPSARSGARGRSLFAATVARQAHRPASQTERHHEQCRTPWSTSRSPQTTLERAYAFYATLFGWGMIQPMPEIDYTFVTGPTPVDDGGRRRSPASSTAACSSATRICRVRSSRSTSTTSTRRSRRVAERRVDSVGEKTAVGDMGFAAYFTDPEGNVMGLWQTAGDGRMTAGRPPGRERPLVYPAELTYPCCLPALGELGEIPPHEGLALSIRDRLGPLRPARSGPDSPAATPGRRSAPISDRARAGANLCDGGFA